MARFARHFCWAFLLHVALFEGNPWFLTLSVQDSIWHLARTQAVLTDNFPKTPCTLAKLPTRLACVETGALRAPVCFQREVMTDIAGVRGISEIVREGCLGTRQVPF